jgi:hypothetical protein
MALTTATAPPRPSKQGIYLQLVLRQTSHTRVPAECGKVFLECGGLPPLFASRQAAGNQSGGKLPHSKGSATFACHPKILFKIKYLYIIRWHTLSRLCSAQQFPHPDRAPSPGPVGTATRPSATATAIASPSGFAPNSTNEYSIMVSRHANDARW